MAIMGSRSVPEATRLHQLLRARRWTILQDVPRAQIRAQGLRVRRRRWLPVHGHRWPSEGRVSSTLSALPPPAPPRVFPYLRSHRRPACGPVRNNINCVYINSYLVSVARARLYITRRLTPDRCMTSLRLCRNRNWAQAAVQQSQVADTDLGTPAAPRERTPFSF